MMYCRTAPQNLLSAGGSILLAVILNACSYVGLDQDSGECTPCLLGLAALASPGAAADDDDGSGTTGPTYVDISAGQGTNSGYSGSAVVDAAGEKLLVITNNFGNGGRASLFRCNLDGSDCTHTNLSGIASGSGHHPSAAVDTANSKLLVLTQHQNIGFKPALFRCDLDGSNCTITDISAGQGANAVTGPPALVIDTANSKVLAISNNGANNQKPSLFRCNLDGSSCTHTDLSSGQGSFSGTFPSAVVDTTNSKLLVVTKNGANGSRPGLFRCNLDGSSCSHTDISAGQGANSGFKPNALVDSVNSKLLVVTYNSGSSGKLSLFRCNLDGSSCTHTDISAGQGDSCGKTPAALIDTANSKLLVVTTNGANDNKSSLFQCDLDGSNCSHTDISAGQGTGSGQSPAVVMNPVTGGLLAITRNDADGLKPGLIKP